MTGAQKLIKYLAMLLAIVLAAAIIFGIAGTVYMLFGFGNRDTLLNNSVKIDISQEISALNIDVVGAQLKIVEGDFFELSSNIKDLKVSEQNGELSIEQKQKIMGIHSNKAGEILLTVPADTYFKWIEIDAGAGDVSISKLVTDKLSFDCGAGRVNLDYIEAKSIAEINTGAGELSIGGGVIHNLDLDLGVGVTYLRAALEGRSEINCGVGEIDISICGRQQDYTLHINTGVGTVDVNGESVKRNSSIGNGANVVDIDGGVGSISINFEN